MRAGTPEVGLGEHVADAAGEHLELLALDVHLEEVDAADLLGLHVGVDGVEPDRGARRIAAMAATEAVLAAEALEAMRTANSRTYRKADGSYVAQFSPLPVNYRDSDGSWKPIDTKLTSDGAGGLQTTATVTPVSLPHDLSDPAKVADGSRWVSFALQDAQPGAAAEVSGSTAVYRDALPDVDATYLARPDGLKETMTLARFRAR